MPGSSLLPADFRRLYKTLLACLLLIAFATPLCAAHDWRYQETHTISHEFVNGGMLHVHALVGDLHIKRGDSDVVRLSYTVKSRREQNLKEVRVDLDVRGRDASIEIHTHSDNTQVELELEVPPNTNLDLHEKVGDVKVENIEGDKEIELGVGDIRVAGPSAYHLVRASAGIGDVHGPGYGETSGWLGKTLRYRGEGKYELRASVGVGDIRLEGK